jgi:formylglycine-generating enzyme
VSDIFLSYAREDLEKARLLASALEKQGWSVFWDRNSILSGEDFHEIIEQEINQTSCMIVGWSKASKKSDWVRGEATVGRERRILLPVLFEQVTPPVPFLSLHAEDFSTWHGNSNAQEFSALCLALKKRLATPPQALNNTENTSGAPSHIPLQKAKAKPRTRFTWLLSCMVALNVIAIFLYYRYDSNEPLGFFSAQSVYKAPSITQAAVTTSHVPATKKVETQNIISTVLTNMVTLPAGEFWMGSKADDKFATAEEKPLHKVKISAFRLSKFETTREQFAQFVQSTGYSASGCLVWDFGLSQFILDNLKNWENPGFTQRENDPVACISYNDAMAFIGWLNTQTNKKFRLPTEAEWEYAARAKTSTTFFWGNNRPEDYAWFNMNSEKKTHPVGSKLANPFGIYDTAGNVWEWVQDCWHENYNRAPQNGKVWDAADNGICGQTVLRGGAWFTDAVFLRPAQRLWANQNLRGYHFGFRLAEDIQ